MPGTLLAAMDMPMPEPQTTIPWKREGQRSVRNVKHVDIVMEAREDKTSSGSRKETGNAGS